VASVPAPAEAPGNGLLSVRAVVRVVAIVVVAVLALYMIYVLRKPLGWIFVAAFIAIAVSGPVNLLSRRMKRGWAIALIYLAILLAPVAMLAILVPPVIEQVNNLLDNAPEYVRDVQDFVNENERLQELDKDYDITTKLQEEASKLPGKIGDAAGVLGDIGSGLLNSIVAGITILTLSIFMVGGGPRWRRAILAAQPPERAEALDRMFDRIGAAVGNYVRGALIQALIAGVTAWIVLLILGVPYPAALALVVFLFDLVPLIGATLGAVLVGIVTLFADFPVATIVWTIWSIIYQQLENNLIQPRIQSRSVQLEPFLVLVSVLFGASLFGVAGAILAIPVAASIQVAGREYLAYRRARVRGPAPPAPAAPAAEAEAPG
jgi:predicted PurR-regulated permease PerM